MSHSKSHPSLVAFPKQQAERVGPHSFNYNLPIQPTPLIGREREVKAACEMLRRPEVRLLTLTGAPGIGKTRLSIEIGLNLADDFPDGIYFVALAPITDPGLVLPAVAQALGIKEAPDQPLSESLANYIRNRQLLLLLDNFEQVIGASTEVAEILPYCPDLKVLVTSREQLHIYGEHDYPVPPLSVPDLSEVSNLEALSHYEALSLFAQRAQAVSPSFELKEHNTHVIAEICLRLDGLPLAIELAAACIQVLPPEELLARLNSRFNLLKGGARNLPERQRTLQAAIDWSYNLLDPAEQKLFRILGVFAGGCTLNAVEEVCGSELGADTLDGITSLVNKSLMQRQESIITEPRFTMLETIREYARKKLEEADEAASIGVRHCDYFLQFVEKAEQGMIANEQAVWVRRLDAEQNNLREALDWTLSQSGQSKKGLRLVGALGRYWQFRGYVREGRQWSAQLLSKTEQAGPSTTRAKALRMLAQMNFEQGDLTEAGSIFEKALEMSRSLGDDWGVAGALRGLGSIALWRGKYDLSLSLHEEALAVGRSIGARFHISAALSGMGTVLMLKEEYRAAQLPLDEALAIDREVGNGVGIANALTEQGSVAFHLGDHEKARALIEESLGIARELGVGWVIAKCLARLGLVLLRQGNLQQTEALSLEGLARAQVSGNKRWSRWYLVALADVARLGGRVKRAAKLIGAAEGISVPGTQYEPAMRAEVDRIIASVRAEIEEETFATLLAEGQAMSLDEAIAYAVEPIPLGIKTGFSTESQQIYPNDLTDREVEVLRQIASGKSNQQIAAELVLSLRTVERHISNIYQKIGVTGRVARATATAYALRHGLIT